MRAEGLAVEPEVAAAVHVAVVHVATTLVDHVAVLLERAPEAALVVVERVVVAPVAVADAVSPRRIPLRMRTRIAAVSRDLMPGEPFAARPPRASRLAPRRTSLGQEPVMAPARRAPMSSSSRPTYKASRCRARSLALDTWHPQPRHRGGPAFASGESGPN